ncbi:hypothetical protein CLAIMM_14502 isoform 2 [Cladophialophora immunda]|nr:hypothetical protein CLAIMM_14502 isoform 1 [Cladophialophora immunda]OQV10518.1 hypothetical protein CLAIMM_14502 isoform 2 [Cladophialophora immunda]
MQKEWPDSVWSTLLERCTLPCSAPPLADRESHLNLGGHLPVGTLFMHAADSVSGHGRPFRPAFLTRVFALCYSCAFAPHDILPSPGKNRIPSTPRTKGWNARRQGGDPGREALVDGSRIRVVPLNSKIPSPNPRQENAEEMMFFSTVSVEVTVGSSGLVSCPLRRRQSVVMAEAGLSKGIRVRRVVLKPSVK